MFPDEAVEAPAPGLEALDECGAQLHEHAVGLDGGDQAATERLEARGEAAGEAVGVGGVPEPGAVAQHRHPLGGREPLLGRQLPRLLDPVGEFAGEVPVEEHHRLRRKQAVLGASEAEHVHPGAPREVGGGPAPLPAGRGGIGEAGAIEVHREPVGAREFPQCPQLGGGIQRAQLGGLSEGERPQLRKVDPVAPARQRRERGGGHLGVVAWDG